MSDDKFYKDGDVVWVKLGNNWWPGEVTGINRQPEGLLKHLKRKPFCVVKFFQEDSYEYVKSSKQIFPYNCNKKDEFTKKGLALFNAKNKFMEKFPGDVEIAERLARRVMESDMLIINDRPDSIVKAILGQTLTRATNDYYGHDGRSNNTNTRRSGDSITKILNITPNRTNETTSNAIFGGGGCTITAANSTTPTTVSSGVPANNSSAAYRCNLCNFTSLRQNVMIFHRKTHSGSNSTTTIPLSVAKISPNKDIKEKSPSSNLPVENTNKSSNEIATTTTTTPLSSKAASAVPQRNVDVPTLEDTYTPTKILRTTRKEEISKTSPSSTSLTVVSKAPHLPSSAESVSSTPTLSHEETKSIVQTPSPPKGTKKKDKTSASALTKRKSLRSSPPEVINVLDESTTLTANDITTRMTINTTLKNDNKTKSNATEMTLETAADIDELKPKRNSEDIIRSWQAEWSDEEESMTTPMSTPKTTIDKTLSSATRLKTTSTSEEPLHTVVENAVKPEDASPVVTVCTPPVVTSRIRNIPKKDRRDIILKEFPPLELSTSNSQSSASLTPPVVVTIVDSGSSSNSNSSESVVVVDELPTTAVVEVLDVIDVDAIEATKTPTTASVSNDIVIHPATELDPESEAVPTPPPPPAATMQTWSCFDFQEEEDNDTDVLSSISKFKKKHLSPEKNSPIENSTPQTVAVRKSEEDLELKDKQLSAEIETLLFQSKSTVVDMSAVATKEDVPVKALPIKERGKRIFKSRNRSRVEEFLNVGGSDASVAAYTVNVSNSDENIPAEVPTEEAIFVNNATSSGLREEEIQVETKQTTELQVENNLEQSVVEENDKIESENENIKTLEENNLKVLDTVGRNLELNATLEEKSSSLFKTNIEEELNKSPSKETGALISESCVDVGEPIVVRLSDVESEIEKENEIEVEQEPKNIDIMLDGKNIFDDEVIPVIKHAPVEIFKDESTTAADNNIIDRTAVQVNEEENENSANIEKEQPKNVANSDRAVSPTANLLNEEINKIKAIQDGEEREKSLVLPLQVNTSNNELENDTTSRFTSPTDENSSIGISEAGAEFGSPTSMLDDERLPIVASNLMTGIERQEHNTNLEEVEGEAHDVSNIEQTVTELMNYVKEEEKEKSTELMETNNTEHPNENKDMSTDQSLKTDEITSNKQKPVQSVEEEATTDDDEIESPPHEMLQSGNELEEELKNLKTTKKIKTRNKTNSKKTNNYNKDGLNNKIKETATEEDEKKKEDKKEKEEEKEKEVKEIHKQQQVRTTRQSVQKLALEVMTKKENKKPQVADKINKNESANIDVLENKNIITIKDRTSKEKTKKKENNTTVISNDKNEKDLRIEVINENMVDSKDITEPTRSIDVEEVRKEPTANETSDDKIESSVKTNDFHKTNENDIKIREATLIDIATKSSEIPSKSPKKDIIEELALLINISEASESNQALETVKTLENSAANKDPVETEKVVESEENIRTEVVPKNINFIETENIKELKAENNKEIKIENNKETASTRKRRSHIKITPRKRNAETPLATENETTIINTKIESKSSQTEAKMRKKSDEFESKIVNSSPPPAQTSIVTTIPDVATAEAESKTDEQIDVVPVDKENEIETTITTTTSYTTATTSNTLSEMRSFRPRRKTNHFETASVLTTATDAHRCENEKTTPADEDRQLATSPIASHGLAPTTVDETEILSLPTVPTAALLVEKVRINVDVANPLSSQIANILATSSGQQQIPLHNKKLNMSSLPTTTTISKTTLAIPLKRKKSIEDDIPSFIIERPCSAAASVTVANAAEKEAFAHVQNKCPQVKITRKEKIIEADLSLTNPVKVPQSLQSPTQMFILNPTAKHQQLGNVESSDSAAMFDIGNMPILLSNEQLLGSSSAESVHIVITPTAAANVIESIVTETGDEQQLSPTSGINQTSILMHVVPTNAAKSPNDGPKIIKQQILQVAHQQSLVEAETKQEQLQQQHEQNQQINIKTRKPASNTRAKRLPSRQQQQQQFLQQQIHEVSETEEDRKKKLKTDQQSLTPHQRQLQEQQRVLQLQKQQQHNVGSQTSNKQIGIDSRGNKYVIIKTNQPPTDLVVQQQLQPPLLEQTVTANQTKIQNAVAAAATSSFSIGAGVTLRAIGETETSVEGTTEFQEQQLQQPKQKSPAAAATGGRKQAGNIITLPSNAAVKQQQHQFTESMQIAAEATVPTNMLSSSPSSSQFVVQQKTNTNNRNLSSLATSNKRTKSSQLSQQQMQQQEIAGNKKLLTTKDKKTGGKSGGISNAGGNRRLSAMETSLPTKIAKTSTHNSFTGDVIAAQQQQQQQQQQTSQPPPLHHLQNRKVKKQQQQQQNRSAAGNSNKKETANINESNDLLRAISQQQQLPSTSSSSLNQQQLQQQQQSVHSTTISEEQLMQIQSEDQIDGTSKILAVPTQPIHGYNETFLLCTLVNNNYKPIDNVPLYLDHDLNQLVPVPLEALDGQPNLIVNHPPPEDIVNQLHTPQASLQQQKQNEQLQQHSAASTGSLSSVRNTPSTSVEADSSTQMLCLQSSGEDNNHTGITEVVPSILEPITHTSAVVNDDSDEAQMAVYIPPECNAELPTDNAVILNIEGQQIILDAATFAHLLANPDANTQLVTDDGTEFVLTREVLAALEAQQDSQEEAAAEQHLQQQLQQTHQISEAGPTDILAVALAGSDLYGNEVLEIETSQGLQLVGADGIVFQQSTLPHQHLTPPITAQTSETNALLNQTPIMSTLEKPSTSGKRKLADNAAANLFGASVSVGDLSPNCRPNLEDSLAVIGVTTSSSSVPTSLELPITVTNPAIAPKSTMAGPTAPVGLSSTSSVVVTESVQFQCLPHRTGGMSTGETRIYNDPGS